MNSFNFQNTIDFDVIDFPNTEMNRREDFLPFLCEINERIVFVVHRFPTLVR